MSRWPFVGRDREANEVVSTLGRGDIPAVLLTGEAGVGKSALAAQVASRVKGSVVKVRGDDTLASYDGIGLLRPEVLEVSSLDPTGFAQAVVERWADSPPELVWVDDVGLLDAESAVVLFHVATQGRTRLLLTSRNGSPASQLVEQLVETGLLRRFEVGPLALQDCSALLDLVLDGPVSSEVAPRMLARSHGNALVIRELVRSAVADGSLTASSGVWQWSGSDAFVPTAAELTANHMTMLSEASRKLVDFVVIAGELPVSAVREAGMVAALDGMIEGDVGVVENDLVRVAHPLFAEAARLELTGDRRRERLGELVRLSAGSARRPGQRLRLLRWRREAGEEMDPSELVEGTHLAMTVFDTATAIDLGQAAVDAGHSEVALPLAMALLYDGQLDAASVAAKIAVEGALDEATRAFASVTGSLAQGYQYGFDASIAESHAELLTSMSEPALAAFVRSELGSALAFNGQLGRAIEVSAPGVAQGAWWERIPFVPGWAGSMTATGRTGEVLDELEGLVAEAGIGAGRSVAWLHAFRSSAALLHGDLDLAESAIADFDELAYLAMVPGVAAVLRSETRGVVAMWRGDIAGARVLLSEAVARSDVPESEFRRVVPASFLAIACALDGDASSARVHAADAAESAERFALGSGWVALAEAWAQASAGDRTGAARTAELGARSAADREHFHPALWCAFDAWRFVPSRAAARLIAEIAEHTDGRWSDAFALTASSWVDGDVAQLDAAGELFQMIGAAGHVELLAQRRSELVGADRQDLLAESLTRREHEVAALAAQGSSNREIAEQLKISVRTAETHLHRAMGKLGVERREDLVMHRSVLDGRR